MARPGRPAINASSTRWQTPWQAEAEPGHIFCYLLAGIGLTAAIALFACTPFNVWTRLAGSSCVLLLLTRQLKAVRDTRLHLIHGSDGLWTVRSGHAHEVSGQLVRSGYRSAPLLILTIQNDEGRLHRFPVWSDQLSGREFSYLQQQLAYAGVSPVEDQAASATEHDRRQLD